jgi:primosomal protein N'
MHCPLCGFDYDESAMDCASRCPMAKVQGCNLLCCPNCGYQMVDERKSGIAKLLRRLFPGAAPRGGASGPGAGGTPLQIARYQKGQP